MPIVANATQENITVKIAGNYFTFKPGQERVIHNASIARFIEMDLKDSGLVVLPELMTEDEEVTPEELEQRKIDGAERKKQILEEGLDRYVAKHREIIYNNQVSLRRDLEMANIKADPAAFASKGELDAMRLVAKYQKRSEDAEQAKIDEVKKLMGAVKGK
jgi:hypothetical protein